MPQLTLEQAELAYKAMNDIAFRYWWYEEYHILYEEFYTLYCKLATQ